LEVPRRRIASPRKRWRVPRIVGYPERRKRRWWVRPRKICRKTRAKVRRPRI
jgi:hypothetical protein